jgi:hypothetical protein
MRPGDLGPGYGLNNTKIKKFFIGIPASHCENEVLMACSVVPPAVFKLQSPVLKYAASAERLGSTKS